MLDNSQPDFIPTQLDPNLLSTPFMVQTNWHMITGTAYSGKTTLIDQLAGEGFQTVPESGRQYFERELAIGRTVAEIRESEADERGMKDLQLRIERGLRANQVIFLDRALPDCLTYFTISMLPYLYSTASLLSKMGSGGKRPRLQVSSMSGSPAITVPWDMA